MSKLPEYIKDGWRQHGPGFCRCPACHTVVSTNALARASHKKICKTPFIKKQEAERHGR